ncbi:MAG: flagellar assembly protein FliH [Treponema sp.]|nr:flagellar assembly protein FliH [Treponema sp.]
MAKAVFRPGELIIVEEKIMISSPVLFSNTVSAFTEAEEAEDQPEVEVYTGPTADDLRREADAFIEQWKTEKEQMIQSAKAEADEIVQAADLSASKARQLCADEADGIKSQAQEEADRIVAEARQKAQELETETRRTLEDERKAALDQSREAGRLEGYAEGKIEVDRLIERTQVVLERAQDKRGEILSETEEEIINLVLLITRKVVKVISDTQRDVIISNVTQALRKVRDRGNIIIRVNLSDLKMTTEHTKDFIQMLEGAKSIQVVEDSSIDSGGCVIETEFGEIDARISSQLSELESKILEISPIKSKVKSSIPGNPK